MIKKILVFLLLLHIFLVISINLITIRGLETIDPQILSKEFNTFGRFYIRNFKAEYYQKYFNTIFNPYLIYTGTDRGYEFFSPNLMPSKMELLFLDKRGNEIKFPFITPESKLKFFSTTYYFNGFLADKKMRDRILRSMSSRFMILNSNLYEINVHLKISEFDNLDTLNKNGYRINQKNIKAFIVSRK